MTVERWTDEMLDKLAESVKELRDQRTRRRIRFTYYQQASQWVVNLAFGLLATATITTIVTAVYRR
jgi:hypothetical protein